MTDIALSSLTGATTLPTNALLLLAIPDPNSSGGGKIFSALNPTVFDPAGAAAAAQAAAMTAIGLCLQATNNLSDLASAATARTNLGLGTAATHAATDFQPAGTSTATPVTTVSAAGASQALTFAAGGDKCYDLTLTANCAITLTGGVAGQYQRVTLLLRQDSTAGRVPTLPAGVRWPNGTAPVPNTLAGKIDVFTFSTPDGGTTVFGNY